MVLSKRLKLIADKVPNNARVADIGTDHGFIPVYLVKEGIIKKAIACDVSKGSLEKAKQLIVRENLEDRIETRLGEGLKVIQPGEVDTVVIAGMGGMLIKSILEESPKVVETVRTFIFQPMVAQDVLRRWLVNNGLAIEDEVLVREDNRIYEIIVAVHGCQNILEDVYYEIGCKLIENNDPLLEEFVLKKIQKTKELVAKLKTHKTPNAKISMERYEKKLEEYKEVYRWVVQLKKSQKS